MKILLTGATGLIGNRLTKALLADGHSLVVLSRKQRPSSNPNLQFAKWDGQKIDESFGPVDAVINLAGAGVADHKWTIVYKKEIEESRVKATKACVEFIRAQTTKPEVFINASAVGYYGTSQPGILDESTGPGKDFLAKVGQAWEAAAAGAGVRTVLLRTGIVMAPEGGAFPKLLQPFKFYAGGYIGTGKQGFPWIHITDEIRLIQFILANKALEGPVNATAPEQLDNKQWAHVMSTALKHQIGVPVPALAVKLLLGESATIVLDGQFVYPKKALEAGFTFQYPTATEAVADLLKASA